MRKVIEIEIPEIMHTTEQVAFNLEQISRMIRLGYTMGTKPEWKLVDIILP